MGNLRTLVVVIVIVSWSSWADIPKARAVESLRRLDVGVLLPAQRLLLGGGRQLYDVHGLAFDASYEIRLSYPSSMPASFSIRVQVCPPLPDKRGEATYLSPDGLCALLPGGGPRQGGGDPEPAPQGVSSHDEDIATVGGGVAWANVSGASGAGVADQLGVGSISEKAGEGDRFFMAGEQGEGARDAGGGRDGSKGRHSNARTRHGRRLHNVEKAMFHVGTPAQQHWVEIDERVRPPIALPPGSHPRAVVVVSAVAEGVRPRAAAGAARKDDYVLFNIVCEKTVVGIPVDSLSSLGLLLIIMAVFLRIAYPRSLRMLRTRDAASYRQMPLPDKTA
eukprot:jgi/Mesvir1/22731/Mv14137-RA.1